MNICYFRGYQLHNPFYTIWATKLGSNLAVSFHNRNIITWGIVEADGEFISQAEYGASGCPGLVNRKP